MRNPAHLVFRIGSLMLITNTLNFTFVKAYGYKTLSMDSFVPNSAETCGQIPATSWELTNINTNEHHMEYQC